MDTNRNGLIGVQPPSFGSRFGERGLPTRGQETPVFISVDSSSFVVVLRCWLQPAFQHFAAIEGIAGYRHADLSFQTSTRLIVVLPDEDQNSTP